jgi:DNA-binding PadR family transcriptional regulator
MGVRDGLLALLDAGPRHGYRLKQEFEAATGGAWELNIGQVYAALQKLESDGLVALDGEDDGRKRYRLTDDGRDRLITWLAAEPVRHTVASRDELSMKVLLAGATTAVDQRRVIATQRDATMAVLQAHTASKASEGPAAPLERLVHLDRLILHCRAELDWLELVEQRLDDRRAAAAAVTNGKAGG